MTEKNSIYKSELSVLFTQDFEEIKNQFSDSKYDWDIIEKYFLNLYKLLIESNKDKDFLKYYYLIMMTYINYTNYLKYIGHKDYSNKNIYKFISNLKFNKKILDKILFFSSNKNIKKLVKIYNPFFSIKVRKSKYTEYAEKFIQDYVQNTKQMELISEMSNDNVKKILNIIIYRYVISKQNNYDTYDVFYNEKIIGDNNLLIDFEHFIKQIPFSKNLLSVRTKVGDFEINLNLEEVIKFIIGKNGKINYIKNQNNIVITHKKFGGKITINIDPNCKNIEFNNNQINYSLVHFSLEEINDLNFLKKTSSNIEIKLNSFKIKDYTTLLDIIHIFVISLKILETYPNDLYECLYPTDYTNYYFYTFCMFFEFIKNSIPRNNGLNKFIIDLVKYIYIYSYYDYYFYYSTNLLETIMSAYNFKHDIFNDFINNLKNTLKIPKELFAFPPFFNINDDINSVVYYNFEIPSYYKYYDLINAICFVFDKSYYKSNNKIPVVNILQKHFNVTIDLNKNNQPNQSNQVNQSNQTNQVKSNQPKINDETSSTMELPTETLDSKSDNLSKSPELSRSYSLSSTSSNSNNLSDLKSRLDSDILTKMTKDEKVLMHNNNTYIELNVENSINCIFNTDIK
jgi:hypothetical protein